MGYHDTERADFDTARPDAAFAPRSLRRRYGRAAFDAAIDNGLMPRELSAVLGGRSIVEAFPVAGRESVGDYAHRAVAEMMVAYVSGPLA